VREYPDMLATDGDMPGPADWDVTRKLTAASLLEESFFAGGGARCWRINDRGGELLSE
jgi:hypothetical protein